MVEPGDAERRWQAIAVKTAQWKVQNMSKEVEEPTRELTIRLK